MSDADMYAWYNAPASQRNTDGTISSGSYSSSSSGGLSSPATYSGGGSYTTNTPVVARPGVSDPVTYAAPVTAPVVAPQTDLLSSIGLGNSSSMISVLLFGGIFVLVMSLFKGS